jgi:mono/diheme cytochrome c family protein
MIKKLMLLAAFLVLGACTKKAEQPAAPLTPEKIFEKGQQVFTMNCVSCHGPDPKKDGPVGPAIWGSSKDLIEARVLRADYPAGYKPKRSTRLMVALPHLSGEITTLHEYLNH